MNRIPLLLLLILFSSVTTFGVKPLLVESNVVKPGAARFDQYIQKLQCKKVGVVANHSSMVGNSHLIDTLLSVGIDIKRIFSPEHGFRGDADAGAEVNSGIDPKTMIPVVSLYGKKKKPQPFDLREIDIIIFDLQDVGVRFYTYISTLTYMMEACAENNIPLIVLDRPNPNGFYIDGPVLKKGFESFVGLHPVPVVYALTIGEYGLMVNGEGWLKDSLYCSYSVVPLEGYERHMICKLPIKPSPNLPDWKSVYLYPSLCFFEGTIMSVGRGTDLPFQIFGHPDFYIGSFVFEPRSIPGASLNPPYSGNVCYGQLVSGYADNYENNPAQINLNWLLESYKILSTKHRFFNNYFNTLAGNDELKNQIEKGLSANQIRKNWENDINAYKTIRGKYLIYPDNIK